MTEVDFDKIELLTSILEEMKISNSYKALELDKHVIYGRPHIEDISKFIVGEANKTFQKKCIERFKNTEKICANDNSAKDEKFFCNKKFSTQEYLDSKESGLTEKIILKDIKSYMSGGIFHYKYTIGEDRKKIFKKTSDAIALLVYSLVFDEKPTN
jgi:hypothetical protein